MSVKMMEVIYELEMASDGTPETGMLHVCERKRNGVA